MRLRPEFALGVLLCLTPLSSLRGQTTEVVATADIAFEHPASCNELDIEGTHTLTLVDLNTTWDSGYPLNVGGDLRTCGIGLLMKSCEASLAGPQWKGRSVKCTTYHHGGKCNKDYRAKTTGSIGNIYLEVDADSADSGCAAEPCIYANLAPVLWPLDGLGFQERCAASPWLAIQ